MTVTYKRIDDDIVEQITTFPEITNVLVQSEIQFSIDETQKKIDDMPKVKPYPINVTDEEKKDIDEWNIENSNKFKKERLKESIDTSTMFLNMLKAVK
jgi:hypothetical protein